MPDTTHSEMGSYTSLTEGFIFISLLVEYISLTKSRVCLLTVNKTPSFSNISVSQTAAFRTPTLSSTGSVLDNAHAVSTSHVEQT
jgi:hypothetical protein